MSALFQLVFLSLVTSLALAASPVVTIDGGKVEGLTKGNIHSFKGIPFAAPPVNENRWAPPKPALPWQFVRKAKEFGAACPQPKRPDRGRDFGPQSEDCLSLNIWAPAKAKSAPVMVWIHGGAFRIGKAGTPFYDGTQFAEKGIVLVSINYRLGHLGFFAHPELSKQAGEEFLGNYGLMDQIAALTWIRDNIAAFGGDPGRITIFGESAGGSSVLHLLAIPQAAGLFHQAIAQSGGGIQRPRYVARDMPGTPSLESIGTDVANQLGVGSSDDVVKALRAVPADELITRADAFAVAGIGFGPVIDGKLVREPLFQSFITGRTRQVPLLIGANSYEASVLAAFGTSATNLLNQLGPLKSQLVQVYTEEAEGDEQYMAELAFGDMSFVAPARAVARVQSAVAPVYAYHLDFVRERARGDVKGAAHGADVVLVFNTLDEVPLARLAFTRSDRKVAEQMHTYWANFAMTGDPNGNGLPVWPQYTTEQDQILLIGNDNIGPRAGYRKNQLDFAMGVLANRGN